MVSISYAFRLGKSTVSNIISNVCDSIWQFLKDEYLLTPSEESWKTIATDFYNTWNIPNCIAAIDGKHVIIQVI